MEDELVRMFYVKGRVILKILMKMGAGKEDAEDILQDTVLKAFTYIDSIPEEQMTAWLYRVSVNSYYTLHTKNKRHMTFAAQQFTECLAGEEKVEQHILRNEHRQEIISILDSLKETHRTLLVMKYGMELTYREISELLFLSEHQVRTYMYRARNQFKARWELNHEYDGER
ncbi:RNA polymerase sigma factor [Paenibacillus sp. RC84]|uniref:RNA polymerase sigma factor n=1 Tax=Paenibacillus sp. RC84 TaxID=3156252 RepID=UPI003516B7BB